MLVSKSIVINFVLTWRTFSKMSRTVNERIGHFYVTKSAQENKTLEAGDIQLFSTSKTQLKHRPSTGDVKYKKLHEAGNRLSFINVTEVPKSTKPDKKFDLTSLGRGFNFPQSDKDETNEISSQISKLGENLKKLKEFAHHLNATEQYKNDIAFLTNNIGSAFSNTDDLQTMNE